MPPRRVKWHCLRASTQSWPIAIQNLDRALESANGLLGLYRLYRVVVEEIDAPTSNALSRRVAEVRNSAAHRGLDPTADDTERSLSTATQLVQAAVPLHL